MSALLTIDEANIAETVIKMLDGFEKDVQMAEPLFELEGRRLEEIARDLPYHQVHYSHKAEEAKQLVKWMENHKAKIEAKLTRNYLQGQRVFSARDQQTLINGEREIIEHNQLIIEATLVHANLVNIVKGFEQMGWMIGHVTKLRVAELKEVVL